MSALERPVHPRIAAIYFDDEGGVSLEWFDDSERDVFGGHQHSTYISPKAIAEWQHVKYYANELHTDVYELLDFYLKYRSGQVP